MPDLIAPHGGLSSPIDRQVPAAEVVSFTAGLAALTKIPVSDADLSTVYRLGDGGLSPLTGFMDGAAFNRVLDEEVVIHGGKKYAWTIPLSLPVDAALAAQLKPGQTAALVNAAGEAVG